MTKITPAELATESGLTSGQIRKFLRAQYKREGEATNKRWEWDEGSFELEQVRTFLKNGAIIPSGSSRGGKSKVGRPRGPRKAKKEISGLNVEGPEPEPTLPHCFCGGVASLYTIQVRKVSEKEDQKVALYRCEDCDMDRETILTLPGWQSGRGYIR